ncbi:MAG: hypothetical protein R6V75_06155 [Bacteroidales bacterium]
MKTKQVITILAILVLGLGMTANAGNANEKIRAKEKKPYTFVIDKPILDFLAKYYAEELDVDDILRVQKVLCKVDHITVSFTEQDVPDYVFYFKDLNQSELEQWMFNAGYLSKDPEPVIVENWMMDPCYLE